MAIASFRRVRSQDNVIRQLQDATSAVFQDIVTREILDGQIITGIELLFGTPSSVSHKLSRPFTGYLVIRKNAASEIWDSPSTAPSSILVLNASVNVTIDIWVF